MKLQKIHIVIIAVVSLSLLFKGTLLKKPDNRLTETIRKGTFAESIKMSGVFHKTASDTQKANSFAAYQNAVSALAVARQNKETADANMWTKQQAVLTAQNEVDFKNENTTNPLTKNDYTNLEKAEIDSALVQAKKDFHAYEKKFNEADIAIAAAAAQINAAQLEYEDTLLNEPVITIDVSEVYAPKIKVGQPATILFDAFNDTPLKGTVQSIESIGTVTSSTVTFETKIAVRDLPADVKPNMTAIVNIEIIRKENTFSVPSSAILKRNGRTYLQTTDGQKDKLIEVTIGEKGLTKVEILTGLENDMRIIVRPTTKNS